MEKSSLDKLEWAGLLNCRVLCCSARLLSSPDYQAHVAKARRQRIWAFSAALTIMSLVLLTGFGFSLEYNQPAEAVDRQPMAMAAAPDEQPMAMEAAVDEEAQLRSIDLEMFMEESRELQHRYSQLRSELRALQNRVRCTCVFLEQISI